MRTVLLAVEGTIPEREILGCAVGLCRRMRAELRVLHILDPGLWKSHGKRLAKQISRGRTLLEASMAAAAFAEAGEHDKAREYMGVKESSSPSLDLASLGVKVWFGTVAFENAESGRG